MVAADMTTVFIMDATAYGTRGGTEQPPASSVQDYKQCPCTGCAYRASCEVECSRFKAYLKLPVTHLQKRLHPAVCGECGTPYLAVRLNTGAPGRESCRSATK